jgi:hypothetical protein
MDIFIDGHKADFKLENETNLFEVAAGIEQWARSSGRYLRKISAGEKSWYGTDDSMSSVPLAGLAEIRIETILPSELASEALSDVLVFFRKLDLLPAEKLASVPDLADSLQWCANVLAKSRVILKLDFSVLVPGRTITAADWMESLEKSSRVIRQDPAAAVRLRTELEPASGAALVEMLLASVRPDEAGADAHPSREDLLRKIRAGQMEIPEIVRKIASITERLHTGHDQSAMNELTEISGSLTGIVRTLQQADLLLPSGFSAMPLETGTSVAEELASLTEIFKRIVEAFDGRDIVLLCDLLEYELSPKLATLDRILILLESELKTGFN